MPLDLARRMAMEALLTDDEVNAIVMRRASSGEPVPVALQALQLASSDAVVAIFDRMGFAQAKKLKPATSLAQKLPKGMMRALWAVPIGESPTGVVVAMADPTDAHALAEMAYHLRRPIDPRTASLDRLRAVLADADRPSQSPGRRTKPAPGAPPPEYQDQRLRAAAASVSDGALQLGAQPSRRRNTPAYGEQSERVNGGTPKSGEMPKRNSRKLAAADARAASGENTPAPSKPITLPGHKAPSGPPTPAGPAVVPHARDSDAPIPLRRRAARSKQSIPPVPKDSLYTHSELRQAGDRDAIGRIVVKGMIAMSERAAFFVVKRGVVQGWEGATVESSEAPGLSRDALRNLWIPVTAQSVFKVARDDGEIYVGALSNSTADSIISAALGGRPALVLLAPMEVRGHTVAFLYADGMPDPASKRRGEPRRLPAPPWRRSSVSWPRGEEGKG